MKKQPISDVGDIDDEEECGQLFPLKLSPQEIAADLEHDRLLHCAFGRRIPSVRTLPLAGSKCNVLVWLKTPRP